MMRDLKIEVVVINRNTLTKPTFLKLICTIFILALTVLAQDTLITSGGQIYPGKIIQVTDSSVTFLGKGALNQQKIPLKVIKNLKHQNGESVYAEGILNPMVLDEYKNVQPTKVYNRKSTFPGLVVGASIGQSDETKLNSLEVSVCDSLRTNFMTGAIAIVSKGSTKSRNNNITIINFSFLLGYFDRNSIFGLEASAGFTNTSVGNLKGNSFPVTISFLLDVPLTNNSLLTPYFGGGTTFFKGGQVVVFGGGMGFSFFLRGRWAIQPDIGITTTESDGMSLSLSLSVGQISKKPRLNNY